MENMQCIEAEINIPKSNREVEVWNCFQHNMNIIIMYAHCASQNHQDTESMASSETTGS